MSARRFLPVWVFLTAAVALGLDRATKAWAEHSLAGRAPIVVIPHVLDLSYTTNSGGAFGLGTSAPWLFAGASVAVAVAIVFAAFRIRSLMTAVALGLVLGGALGNLADRVFRGGGVLDGHVVDFIDLHIWPVFNVADSAVVIGALLLALLAVRGEEA